MSPEALKDSSQSQDPHKEHKPMMKVNIFNGHDISVFERKLERSNQSVGLFASMPVFAISYSIHQQY